MNGFLAMCLTQGTAKDVVQRIHVSWSPRRRAQIRCYLLVETETALNDVCLYMWYTFPVDISASCAPRRWTRSTPSNAKVLLRSDIALLLYIHI